MKFYLLLSTLVLLSFTGCDRSKGKGSDIEWQERQEEIERDRQEEERSREVNIFP